MNLYNKFLENTASQTFFDDLREEIKREIYLWEESLRDEMGSDDYENTIISSSGNNEFKYELRVENVPTGTYTVTETNSTFDGYVLTKKTGDESPQYVKKYEQPGDETVVDFVDEYEMAVGSLEIVKEFKDAPSNLDASKIEFEIEGPACFNNGTKLTVTYDMFTEGKYVISDAPIGDYIVTETSRQDSLIDGNYKYTFDAT